MMENSTARPEIRPGICYAIYNFQREWPGLCTTHGTIKNIVAIGGAGYYVFLRVPGEHDRVHLQQKGVLFEEKVRLANGQGYYLSDHIGLMVALDFEAGYRLVNASPSQ